MPHHGKAQLDWSLNVACMYIDYWGSVRPKPLFWFRSNTKMQNPNLQILSANTVTDTKTTFQEGESSYPLHEVFFFQIVFQTLDFWRLFLKIRVYKNLCIPQEVGKNEKNLKLQKKNWNKKVSVSEQKFRLWYQYWNWTIVLVPDIETWVRSHTITAEYGRK